MKKHLSILLILAIAFGAICSLTACDPTTGLDPVSFEDIANAKLYDTYNVTSTTITYDSEGQGTSESGDPDTMNKAAVKAKIAASKLAIETSKIVYSKTYGDVYANKDYSKIVVYIYYKNSDDKLVSKSITTYTKK